MLLGKVQFAGERRVGTKTLLCCRESALIVLRFGHVGKATSLIPLSDAAEVSLPALRRAGKSMDPRPLLY